MPLSPLGSTHGRTTSGAVCHHSLWAALTVGRCRALHAIIAFGKHTRSYDVERGMPSSPLGITHGRTTSGVACNHNLWAAQIVGRRRAWHAILALGRQTWSNDVGRGMPSLPLGSTDGRTASGVSCDHRLLPSHTVERCRAWHAIIALGQHIRSNDIGCGMPSSPLGSTHGRTMSGVTCHHHLWAEQMVERRQAWYAITAL